MCVVGTAESVIDACRDLPLETGGGGRMLVAAERGRVCPLFFFFCVYGGWGDVARRFIDSPVVLHRVLHGTRYIKSVKLMVN